VAQGAEAHATFSLRNQSSCRIDVVRVSTDCTCIVVTLEKRRLEPGESTSLHVTLAAQASRGEMRANAIVSYQLRKPEESEMQQLHLSLRVFVDPAFALSL